MDYLQRWRKTAIANQALVITGALVAFSSVVYTGATVFQVYMLKQSGEQATRQTDKMIAASERLAAATTTAQEDARKSNTEMLDKAERITRANEELVKTATKQANASMSQANTSQASARAAERSADIAAQSFNIGERPYITLTQQIILVDFAVDKTPRVDIFFGNSGRTPALNVHARSYTAMRPERRLGKVEYLNPPTLSEVVIQASSHPYKQSIPMFSVADQQIVNTLIEAIKQKQFWYFVYGIIEYNDGAGRPHTLKFCNVYNPAKSEMEFCEEHNTSQ